MLIVDGTVMNVALPHIQEGLGFSTANLSWVINAYTLTFGGLLLLGGRAGDILGRRRMFVFGIALFTIASLVGGLATSATWLLAARVAQGVGAAMAGPNTIALISTTFTEPRQRIRALALLSAMASAGFAIGLIIGGVLTDALSWRWVLFINVPFGIAAVLLAPRHVREPERHPGRLEWPGAATATLGIGALVYGFIHASTHGWTAGETRALARARRGHAGRVPGHPAPVRAAAGPAVAVQGPQPRGGLCRVPAGPGGDDVGVLLPDPVHPDRARLRAAGHRAWRSCRWRVRCSR